eukprot:1153064-Pelagomonas_calceolata.AAC.2
MIKDRQLEAGKRQTSRDEEARGKIASIFNNKRSRRGKLAIACKEDALRHCNDGLVRQTRHQTLSRGDRHQGEENHLPWSIHKVVGKIEGPKGSGTLAVQHSPPIATYETKQEQALHQTLFYSSFKRGLHT